MRFSGPYDGYLGVHETSVNLCFGIARAASFFGIFTMSGMTTDEMRWILRNVKPAILSYFHMRLFAVEYRIATSTLSSERLITLIPQLKSLEGTVCLKCKYHVKLAPFLSDDVNRAYHSLTR